MTAAATQLDVASFDCSASDCCVMGCQATVVYVRDAVTPVWCGWRLEPVLPSTGERHGNARTAALLVSSLLFVLARW